MLSTAIYRIISFLYAFVVLALQAYVRVSLAHLCCKINSNRLQFLFLIFAVCKTNVRK